MFKDWTRSQTSLTVIHSLPFFFKREEECFVPDAPAHADIISNKHYFINSNKEARYSPIGNLFFYRLWNSAHRDSFTECRSAVSQEEPSQTSPSQMEIYFINLITRIKNPQSLTDSSSCPCSMTVTLKTGRIFILSEGICM